MKDVYEIPILAIVKDEGIAYQYYPTTQAALKALVTLISTKITIAMAFKIPVLDFENDRQLALALKAGFFKSNKSRPSYKPTRPKKQKVPDIRIDMLKSLPGVGDLTAKKILNDCINIEEFCKLSEKELQLYRGISSIRAKKIKQVLSGE